MASMWGNYFKISLFGESHGGGIGITIDGLPAGTPIDMPEILREMARRAPGNDPTATARRESDTPEILSGVYLGKATGTPICAVIRNTNQHSGDYGEHADILRPGHADYTGNTRYFGFQDHRGGGHFSGRLTAPIVFAGALAKAALRAAGIRIYAHIAAIDSVHDRHYDDAVSEQMLAALAGQRFPVLDAAAAAPMEAAVLAAKQALDSVGGIIECVALGVPAGVGAPFFDSVESTLAHLLFSIPAVKGVEFGLGFQMAEKTGSECNDEMVMQDGNVRLRTNRNGGINGGIANGCPIILRACFRPTPSIARVQETVSLARQETVHAATHGRHDPCIVPRAVPVVEAMTAIGLLELIKERKACRI